MSDNKNNEDIKGQVYFHINNGGVNFKIINSEFGPLLKMEASHFGSPTGSVGVYVKKDDLVYLRNAIDHAINEEFNKDYCCAAECTQKVPKLPPVYVDFETDSFTVEHKVKYILGDFQSKEVLLETDRSVKFLHQVNGLILDSKKYILISTSCGDTGDGFYEEFYLEEVDE